MSFSFAFNELTKSFDLVSRGSLFKVTPQIGCQHKLHSMTDSFHTGMNGIVQFSDSSSEPFDIRGSVKQGCVLAAVLFYLSLLNCWKMSSTQQQERYACVPDQMETLQFREIRQNNARIRYILFADDAAVATHTQQELQSLMNHFFKACEDFGLTIRLKKTNIMGQYTEAPPGITIDDYELGVVCQFTFLGSSINANLSPGTEIN